MSQLYAAKVCQLFCNTRYVVYLRLRQKFMFVFSRVSPCKAPASMQSFTIIPDNRFLLEVTPRLTPSITLEAALHH